MERLAEYYDHLAYYVYELCKLIKEDYYDLLRDEDGDLFDVDTPKELIDLVDYLSDRKELELDDLCVTARDYIYKSGNWNSWLVGDIKMPMFIGEPKRANENFNLIYILKIIKNWMGIDYWIHWIEDAHVWVTFKLHYKEHFMVLDDIIFDETMDEYDKADVILNNLIYYFDLADEPIDEFKNAIEKEFTIYEAKDGETVNVNVILGEGRVEVTLTNNETGEERMFEGFIDEEVTDEDIRYDNASELGYKMAHLLLIDYWNL